MMKLVYKVSYISVISYIISYISYSCFTCGKSTVYQYIACFFKLFLGLSKKKVFFCSYVIKNNSLFVYKSYESWTL